MLFTMIFSGKRVLTRAFNSVFEQLLLVESTVYISLLSGANWTYALC